MSDNLSMRLSRRETMIAAAGALALPLIGGEAFAAAPSRPQGTFALGRSQPFDFDWQFLRRDGASASPPSGGDTAWRSVDLPHDWSIEDLPTKTGATRIGPFDAASQSAGATAFTLGGEGWYRKRFSLVGLPQGGRAQILFGGVYGETELWLNGVSLGQHVHGYTPFAIDLTPHLRPGENTLLMRVRNLGKNSRWYSGSGIYRSAMLDVLPEAAGLARWGTAVSTTRIVDGRADIAVATQLDQPAAGLTLVSRILDENRKVIAEQTSPAAAAVTQNLALPQARLWSPDAPALYTLESELQRDGRAIDRTHTTYGVRVISFDARRGMLLNGQPVELRGGCVHHDNGLLGAAAYPDAEERRVRLLKARGYNAIRSSHYPCSAAFADACDKFGMFLIEEAFDMWDVEKNPQDYAQYFDAWSDRDLTAMVLSSRNRPSVVMWSIGNEIPGRLSDKGQQIAWHLANLVHRLDPTRPVTAAINGFGGRPVIPDAATARPGMAGKPNEPSIVALDVAGYNYKLDHYARDHPLYPERVIYGSETFPKDIFTAWAAVEEHPYVVGDFVWTAMDYLGEAAIGNTLRNKQGISMSMIPAWPWVLANCGDVDLIGHQRPQSLARDVVWGVSPVELAVQRPLAEGEFEHISLWGWSDEPARWTWQVPEGTPLKVRVYAKADRVVLNLNGAKVDEAKLSAATKLPVEVTVPYSPGTLEAIAYRGTAEIGRRRIETVGQAKQVMLKPEAPRSSSARGSLSYVHVDLVDAQGRPVPDLAAKVSLTVSGPARLVAFGSANPQARRSFQSSEAETFDGRALAILMATGAPGTVRVLAQSGQLVGGSTRIRLD